MDHPVDPLLKRTLWLAARPALLLLVALALLSAGCTNGDDTAASTTAPGTTPITITSVPSTLLPPPTAVPTTTSSTPPTTTTPPTPAAKPTGHRLDPGLYCRDIATLGGSYQEAAAYWITEGRPGRMDVDQNGIPCETVYSDAEIDGFLKMARTQDAGLFCRGLQTAGLNLPDAIAYWIVEGAPDRMDADHNGIPCETVYPGDDFAGFFPTVSRWQSFTNGNSIADLAIANDGTVWTVGWGGAVHWNPANGEYTKFVVEDGLPTNAVNAVAMAGDGTIWLATMSGASSYDGRTWTNRYRDEPLYSVLSAADGRIWFGGDDQVIVLNGERTRRFTHDDGISYEVKELAESPDGTMYAHTAGCDGEGCRHGADYPDILRLTGGSWETVATAEIDRWTMRMHLLHGDGELMFDRAGVLWATGGDPNLLSFDGDTWSWHDVHVPSQPVDRFRAATIDDNDVIWLGNQHGVARFEGATATRVPVDTTDTGSSNVLSALAVDPHTGGLWAGTYDGLAGYDNATWTLYRTDDEMVSNNAWTLAQGDEDLWVGTTQGLARINAAGWTTFTTETLIDAGHVEFIAIAPDGDVWAGNTNSISWYDGSEWYAEGGRSGEPPREGSGLYQVPLAVAPNGDVWAIARHGGELVKYEGGAWTSSPQPEACGLLRQMEADGNGRLWTVTWGGGLCSYDGVDWTVHIDMPPGVPPWEPQPEIEYPGIVLALAVDQAGDAIVSTDQAGLVRWDGTSWEPVDGAGSTPEMPTAIAFGADGTIWVVAGDEFLVLRNGQWELVPTEFSLLRPSAIVVDSDGVVWVGTGAGLMRYLPQAQESTPTHYSSTLGWSRSATAWPGLSPGCCGGNDVAPVSPSDPWPAAGWPADGFYPVWPSTAAWDELETGQPIPAVVTSYEMTIARWIGVENRVRIDDAAPTIQRVLPLDDTLTVIIRSFQEDETQPESLVGDGLAFRELLVDLHDWWQVDPSELFRTPDGSRINAGIRWWFALEIRGGKPVLYLHAGFIAG
jgi:ligand-binding sensor domain-containing protein